MLPALTGVVAVVPTTGEGWRTVSWEAAGVIVTAVGAAAAVGSLTFVGVQLQRDRRRQSYEDLTKLIDDNVAVVRDLRQRYGDRLSAEEAERVFTDHCRLEERRLLRQLLNDLETLALGCRRKTLDLRAVEDLARTSIVNTYERYREFVRLGQARNPKAYEHLEWLVGELERRR